jgi:hypothetical protein
MRARPSLKPARAEEAMAALVMTERLRDSIALHGGFGVAVFALVRPDRRSEDVVVAARRAIGDDGDADDNAACAARA